jgi:hypothetical protein
LVLQTNAFDRLAILANGFWILDLFQSQIRNPKSKIETRTTGFEPAISNLKGWWLQTNLPTSSKITRGKIRTSNLLILSQLPLPFGLHAHTDFGFYILDFGFISEP